MARRKHEKKPALQPLVPIAGPWLQAAMEARGLGVVQVQRQLGLPVARQTLSYILAGTQRTCRADVRRALATVLRVAEDFLAGQPQGTGAWARTLDLTHTTAAVALAELELTQRAFAAWCRDVVARERALSKVPVSEHPRSPWARHLQRDAYLGFALHDLTNPDVWRRQFLTAAPALTPDERNAAQRHLVAALDVILSAWFAGRAQINTEAVRAWWPQATTVRSGERARGRPTVVGAEARRSPQHRRKS